jgi:hypothetical protein
MIHPGIFCPPLFEVDQTFCHTWHNVHPLLPALWHHVQPSLKQNVAVFSNNFWIWFWCPTGCLAKCGHFITWFLNIFMMTNLLSGKMWTFCHRISGDISDDQPAVRQNVDILSLDFWTHLWCPTSCWATSGLVVTWLLNVSVMINLSYRAKCGHFKTLLWCPTSCKEKCGHFVTWFLGTVVMSNWYGGCEIWTFSLLIFWHISDVQLAIKQNVTSQCIGGAIFHHFALTRSFWDQFSHWDKM